MASSLVLERLGPASRSLAFGLAQAEWETIVPVLAEQEAAAARAAAGAEHDAAAAAEYAQRLAGSFRAFIEPAWAVLEPATPFVQGYHVDAIAEHLQAVHDGELQNVALNLPPRHGKSTLVSVIWPAWEWLTGPELRYLFASYGLHLSIRDSVKCRDLITSAWYRWRWGDRYGLKDDQNQKSYFRNDRGGQRLASSVGGVGTGEGGERIIVDDPHNVVDIEKGNAQRENVLHWWDGAMTSRVNDPATVSRIIVMQRTHERDLTGHVLAKMAEGGEEYEHLVLPAEYEPRVTVCLSSSPKPLAHDPRTTPGQPLSPERFPTPALRKLEIGMGKDRYAGQYQQRPAPAGGVIFQRECWADGRNRYHLAEHEANSGKVLARWCSWDTAFKDAQSNDFSSRVVLELLMDYRVVLRDVYLERLQFPLLLSTMEADATYWNADGKLRGVIIEDKGSGTSAGQSIAAAAPAWLAELLEMFMPVGSKVYRARQASLWCELGCLLLPHPSELVPWLDGFAGPDGRLWKFPNLEHDDDIDALSQGLLFLENYLAEGYHARTGAAA